MTEVDLSVDGTAPVDLSFPIDPRHFRWAGERLITESLDQGAPFTSTRFTQSAHAFTHVDAPSHIRSGAADLADLSISTWVGPASVLDLSGIADGAAITADHLQDSAAQAVAGDIILLRTDWDSRRDIATPEYWSAAPWIAEDAAGWLRRLNPPAVGFDFPQDEAIRRAVRGEPAGTSEFTTHQQLLAHGIGLIEYLRGLRALPPRVLLCAAPIALMQSDGAPTRAVAFPLTPSQIRTTPHQEVEEDQ